MNHDTSDNSRNVSNAGNARNDNRSEAAATPPNGKDTKSDRGIFSKRPIRDIRNFVAKRSRPSIDEVVRETTSGGIVFRRNDKNQVEILLIQDAKNRWTIPKGHVEEGEEPKQTAEREIREETGLQEMKVYNWLGKVNFRYRRTHTLVLMAMHIYLVQGLGDTNKLEGEDWLATQSNVVQNVTSFEVKTSVSDSQRLLKSGMNVSLEFKAGELKNVLVVPTAAIVQQTNAQGIFVAKDKADPVFVPITIGITINDKTEVKSGLTGNEQILLSFPPGTEQYVSPNCWQ